MSESGDTLSKVSGLSGSFVESHYLIPEDTSWEEWFKAGVVLQAIHKHINFWIGDWILYGENKFPDTYSQAVFLTGKSDTTLRNCAWVASVFPAVERRDLSWTHHLEVAGMENTADRDHLLDKAEEEEWSAGYLRSMRNEIVGQNLPVLPEPEVTRHTVPYDLQDAVNQFCSVVTEMEIKPQSFQVPFDWGYIEMKVVKH
tara:strand:+ start:1881 stop:2480 length:600 start_codon:yes stop_codon:yes gene_type:complete